MRRFDSRRQEENETIPDFEQALRTLHREAGPAATPEQRDAALKRRFEDGLISTEMTLLRVVFRETMVIQMKKPVCRYKSIITSKYAVHQYFSTSARHTNL